jgi:hypothetical protein
MVCMIVAQLTLVGLMGLKKAGIATPLMARKCLDSAVVYGFVSKFALIVFSPSLSSYHMHNIV